MSNNLTRVCLTKSDVQLMRSLLRLFITSIDNITFVISWESVLAIEISLCRKGPTGHDPGCTSRWRPIAQDLQVNKKSKTDLGHHIPVTFDDHSRHRCQPLATSRSRDTKMNQRSAKDVENRKNDL